MQNQYHWLHPVCSQYCKTAEQMWEEKQHAEFIDNPDTSWHILTAVTPMILTYLTLHIVKLILTSEQASRPTLIQLPGLNQVAVMFMKNVSQSNHNHQSTSGSSAVRYRLMGWAQFLFTEKHSTGYILVFHLAFDFWNRCWRGKVKNIVLIKMTV